MLDYSSIKLLVDEDVALPSSLQSFRANSQLFADTEETLKQLATIIQELKKQTADLFINLIVEISNYHYGLLEEKDLPKKTEEDNSQQLLSKREKEVLKLVFEGLTNKEIAGRLFISFETVKSHRKNILNKTESKNTAALANKINLSQLE